MENKILNVTGDGTLEKLITFLDNLNLNPKRIKIDKYGFSRTIEFFNKAGTFHVEWFKNMSTLFIISDSSSVVSYHFRYVALDENPPSKDKFLSFSWELGEKVFGMQTLPFYRLKIALEQEMCDELN